MNMLPNGWRYLRVGGRGFCLGAEKTRSQKLLEMPQNPTRQVPLCVRPVRSKPLARMEAERRKSL